MDSYLELFSQNQARLLSEKPTQSHDSYAWTVYTTWQISFDQLSQVAATLLQLCSFLHYKGISEDIFSNAARYKFHPFGPSREELQKPLKFLSEFLDTTGSWDSLKYLNLTNEIKAYSLINVDSKKKSFSIHPLVHEWMQKTLINAESQHSWMIAILGMSITAISGNDMLLSSLKLVSHVDSLIFGEQATVPEFQVS